MKRWGLGHFFSRMETPLYWLRVSAIHCTDTGLIDVYYILSIDSLLNRGALVCTSDGTSYTVSSEVQSTASRYRYHSISIDVISGRSKPMRSNMCVRLK